MQIPKRLSYILERDQTLDGAVKFAISQFEPWIKHSHLPFFPEYTDHGLEHIESVLRTASGLIRDDAWEAITSADTAVLILSVLLHDCAMHLSEDGFFSLLEEDRSKKLIPGMRDKPWNHLWEDFFGEAARFDGRQLVRLFGDAQPVRRPPRDPNALSKRDRLLIGEFLRRHHPRLAQEVAIYGVPTSGQNPLVLGSFDGVNQHIARLAGLVARSHGADIRTFLPILRDEFDIRQFKSVHPVILMTLLRVADYLQLDAERAPAQVLQIRRLASPVSEGEWKAHHAIKDIRHTHEDPEAIFIDADPENVETFLRVRAWQDGIQRELDASWAVLGEVYGRYEGLKGFGLLLRRVRSSLDDLEAFSQRASYLPVKATFRAADADLLKLLIEPLYGNHPEVGLRELIQNAVDACRELQEYRRDLESSESLEQIVQEGDVVVRLESGDNDDAWVTISDKGIGMSSEIVINYFLAAGASFRRSENWRKTFESEEGKSKILRAGRFGVGALAAFLLGSEIEVSTRHVDEPHGLYFKASVASDAIELKKYDRPVGTTIIIRFSKSIADRLMESNYEEVAGYRWDWYCLPEPSLVRFAAGKTLAQEYLIPTLKSEDMGVWRRIEHSDFSGILWTYNKAPGLVCNGIRVQSLEGDKAYFNEFDWNRKVGLKVPNLAVFDPDGKLPLNLQRTGLAERNYPFDGELLESIYRDFAVFSLVRGPTSLPTTLKVADTFRQLIYSGSARHYDWYFTSQGFGYIDAFAFRSRKTVLVVRVSGARDRNLSFVAPITQAVIPVIGDETLTGQDMWIREMLDHGYFEATAPQYQWVVRYGGASVLHRLRRQGIRILLSSASFSRAKNKLPKYIVEAIREEWNADGWHLVAIGTCPTCEFDFASFIQETGKSLNPFSSITEVYLDQQAELEQLPMTKAWSSLLGVDVIPFNAADRAKKCKRAYKELKEQMKLYSVEKSSAVGSQLSDPEG